MTHEQLKEIENRQVDSLSGDAPYNADVWTLDADRRSLLAHIRQLTEDRDRLQAKVDKDHDELRDKRTDLLDIRGILSPQGRSLGLRPVVPMPLGKDVAPAVEWLAAEADRLRADLGEALSVPTLGDARAEIGGLRLELAQHKRGAAEARRADDERYAALVADRDRAREIAVALEQQTAQLAALADQLDRDATDNDATCDERINELIGQTGSWSGRDPDIARLRALVENQRDIAATIRRALGGESS